VQQLKLADDPYAQERIDMAAAFRWTARLNMHEGISNHFSLAVSENGSKFLLNPYGRHFSMMRASDLLLVDANDPAMGERDDIDLTAWCIHGAMHRNNPGARCIMHVHSKYALALASLKDSSMPPIDQNTMRFYNRIAVDDSFDGLGVGDEAERLSKVMGNKRLAIMGNHGVIVIGNTVAEVFDEMYCFERACETLITALSTGRELRIASHEVAEKTAQQFEDYPEYAKRHLAALKDILDLEEPEYRD
jgi:ribulose-5-phosphate 4-epimerase/fuculose-1-phosphate aldolase